MSEQRFFRFLQERIGLDVESVGTAMVERALRQRCTLVQAADLDDYWLRLQQSSDEQQALIEAVIVPETWFFRYPESFTALAGWRTSVRQNLPAHGPCASSACRARRARSPTRSPWPCSTVA